MILPAEPKIVFGVFDRWFREPSPHVNCDTYKVGYKIEPRYGFQTRFSENRGQMEEVLPDEYNRWLRSRKGHVIRQLSVADALVGKTVTIIVGNLSWGEVTITFDDGDWVSLRRTKSDWMGITYEAPEEFGPVARVLADCRTVVFENKQRLKFSNKMGVHSISDSFVEKLFA